MKNDFLLVKPESRMPGYYWAVHITREYFSDREIVHWNGASWCRFGTLITSGDDEFVFVYPERLT